MKVLVIKTSSLGDVIHTLPAITDAVHALPNLEIDWVVEEAFVDIPRMHAAVRRVIPVAWRRWRNNILQKKNISELRSFWRALRLEHYDYIIDAQGLLKSAVLGWLAHGVHCGFAKGSVREAWAAYFYQHQYTVATDLHAITRIRQLFAAALNYQLPLTQPDYGIKAEQPDATYANKNYLIFFHGTSRKDKCWSELQWIELAKLAVQAGYFVYLPWGNEIEYKRAVAINENVPATLVLPKMRLAEIAALISQARGVIAVDTGLGHLAAALNIPTISLYGPTDPKLIGTWGRQQQHLLNFQTLTAADVWRQLDKFKLI